MSQWYWTEQNKRRGPCSGRELKELVASGRVQPMTLVWKHGLSEWVAAKTVKSLFDEPDPAKATANADNPPPLPKAPPAMPVSAEADLKSLNFREEVVPLNATNLTGLLRDYVFWGVTLLGVVPSLIGTLGRPDYQLTTFALFFAILWGVVFKYFIVRGSQTWPILLVSLFSTGIGGLFVLLKLNEYVLPKAYLNLIASESRAIAN